MNFHICSFTDKYSFILSGKDYYFEFSDRFGPLFLDQRTHEPTKAQRAPVGFWKAFDKWMIETGRKEAPQEITFKATVIKRGQPPKTVTITDKDL